MPRWKQLEQDISAWLSSFTNSHVAFRNSYQAITGFPSDGFRSDGMLTDGSTLLAVEVEGGQMHPDTNVGKYWLLYAKFQSYDKIILFHAYTPDFNSYGWRMRLGEFYAAKMKAEVPIQYVLLDYRHAEDYDTVLADLKSKVAEAIHSEFGIPGNA